MALNIFLKKKRNGSGEYGQEAIRNFNSGFKGESSTLFNKKTPRSVKPDIVSRGDYFYIPEDPGRPRRGNRFLQPALPAESVTRENSSFLPSDLTEKLKKRRARGDLADFPTHNNSGEPDGNSYTPGASGGKQVSFEDYYDRLIETLESYGVKMTLPTLDELYGQLEAFLRPSADAAIRERKAYGETALAELDADAYARGMGNSSYLTNMKYREYEDIARDIAELEAKYDAEAAEYLYDITSEINDIQLKFAETAPAASKTERDLDYGCGHGYDRDGDWSFGEKGSERETSEETPAETSYETPWDGTPKPSGTTFEQYKVFLECLTKKDVDDFFHSDDEYWAELRSQMTADITAGEYEYLLKAYDSGD